MIVVALLKKKMEVSANDSPSAGGAPSLRPDRFRFANNRNATLEAGERMNRLDWSAAFHTFHN